MLTLEASEYICIWSVKIDKYEYLEGGEILSFDLK